jgi:hypothetical protein
MPVIEGTVYCERCGAEIVGAPVVRDGVLYCCDDCADGGECNCALLLEDDRGRDSEGMGEAES